jgi:hypothetical protein
MSISYRRPSRPHEFLTNRGTKFLDPFDFSTHTTLRKLSFYLNDPLFLSILSAQPQNSYNLSLFDVLDTQALISSKALRKGAAPEVSHNDGQVKLTPILSGV